MPEWLKFLLADTSALQLVFWFVAIGALVAVIVKLWPALSQFVTIMNAVTGLPEFIERTDGTLTAQSQTLTDQNVKIDAIHHEVHYNNGTSVKDSQARTERVINEQVLPALEQLTATDEELRNADERLRVDLENTHPSKREEP